MTNNHPPHEILRMCEEMRKRVEQCTPEERAELERFARELIAKGAPATPTVEQRLARLEMRVAYLESHNTPRGPQPSAPIYWPPYAIPPVPADPCADCVRNGTCGNAACPLRTVVSYAGTPPPQTK